MAPQRSPPSTSSPPALRTMASASYGAGSAMVTARRSGDIVTRPMSTLAKSTVTSTEPMPRKVVRSP